MKKTIMAFALLLVLCSSVSAGENNLIKMTKEMQIITQDTTNFDMVWWMPTEYWEESYKNSPLITPEQIEGFMAILDVNSIFSIIEADLGTFGGVNGSSEEEIFNKIVLEKDSIQYAPLGKFEYSDDLFNLVQMLKPVMANMLGQMGSNMHMIIFPAFNKDGNRIIDPLKHGSFKIIMGEKEFSWRLPLGCLLPDRIDPKTNEIFPGNYKFNPYTGKKLEVIE